MSTETKSGMSDEHKAALGEGRAQGRAVRSYLEALAANRPKRGRKRTPDSIKKRLDRIEEELGDADRLKHLQLVQERIDLERELAASDKKGDLDALSVSLAYGETQRAQAVRVSCVRRGPVL